MVLWVLLVDNRSPAAAMDPRLPRASELGPWKLFSGNLVIKKIQGQHFVGESPIEFSTQPRSSLRKFHVSQSLSAMASRKPAAGALSNYLLQIDLIGSHNPSIS